MYHEKVERLYDSNTYWLAKHLNHFTILVSIMPRLSHKYNSFPISSQTTIDDWVKIRLNYLHAFAQSVCKKTLKFWMYSL